MPCLYRQVAAESTSRDSWHSEYGLSVSGACECRVDALSACKEVATVNFPTRLIRIGAFAEVIVDLEVKLFWEFEEWEGRGGVMRCVSHVGMSWENRNCGLIQNVLDG